MKERLPTREKKGNYDCTNSLFALLHPFTNLMIGEVIGSLSSERPFYKFALPCSCLGEQTIKIPTT